MDPNVTKCKSSNSGKTTRSDIRNKKSRSSADFPPYVMKKRGVYVEKKATKIGINEREPEKNQERPKAPPRPKPGNKRFVASVLSILSKSTTGTQYPDIKNHKDKNDDKQTEKKIKIEKHMDDEGVNASDAKLPKPINNERIEEKIENKRKYRSKALNDEVDKEAKQEKLLILQSRKEIIQTPSIYSENEFFNWTNLPLVVKRAQQNDEEYEDKKVEEVGSELAKEIAEGKKGRRVRIDEPKTLEVRLKPKADNDALGVANNKLYSFFVDLLESTINDNDTKTNPLSDTSSTKIRLELDESVVKKLNVKSEKVEKPEPMPSNHFCCLKDVESHNIPNPPYHHPKHFRSKNRKYKSESYSFLRKPVASKLKTESVIETKKSISRKQQKKTLLNLFKEQLKMDEFAFEEPQNMYQALKIIAQNKRRCQKTIHFEESLKRRNKDYGFPECMFKRRKVISPSTKETNKKKKNKNYVSSIVERSEFSCCRRLKSDYAINSEDHDSYQSLEVHGYDYGTQPTQKEIEKPEEKFIFTYHSTPSLSNCSVDTKDLLDFTETDSNLFNAKVYAME